MFYKPNDNDARIEWVVKDDTIRPLPTPPWDKPSDLQEIVEQAVLVGAAGTEPAAEPPADPPATTKHE